MVRTYYGPYLKAESENQIAARAIFKILLALHDNVKKQQKTVLSATNMTHGQTDGQTDRKSPSDCSNPLPMFVRTMRCIM